MGVRMRSIRVTTGDPGEPSVMDVTPKPRGSTREVGSGITSAGDYTDIVSYTPADGKTFDLSKIIVTWEGGDEQEIVLLVGSEIVGEYFATAYVMDWFPPGIDLVGDGVKTILIKAKAKPTPATLIGFINGQVT